MCAVIPIPVVTIYPIYKKNKLLNNINLTLTQPLATNHYFNFSDIAIYTRIIKYLYFLFIMDNVYGLLF